MDIHNRESIETKILIQIVDENDNAPKFNQTEYSIQVCSNRSFE